MCFWKIYGNLFVWRLCFFPVPPSSHLTPSFSLRHKKKYITDLTVRKKCQSICRLVCMLLFFILRGCQKQWIFLTLLSSCFSHDTFFLFEAFFFLVNGDVGVEFFSLFFDVVVVDCYAVVLLLACEFIFSVLLFFLQVFFSVHILS